jgi:hypothetical protein
MRSTACRRLEGVPACKLVHVPVSAALKVCTRQPPCCSAGRLCSGVCSTGRAPSALLPSNRLQCPCICVQNKYIRTKLMHS